MGATEFRTLGAYVSESLFDRIETQLYDVSGCLDLRSYFDSTPGRVPRGDPVGEVTAQWGETIVSDFANLYDDADFDAASELPYDEYVLLTLAVTPRHVYALRDRFHAAAVIQGCDTRTAQTALFDTALTEHPIRHITISPRVGGPP